jgi:sugar (pentulose or hexulose) kinase
MAGAGAGHPALNETSLFVGVDIGTSGCRAIAIDSDGAPAGTARAPLPAPGRTGPASLQDPDLWRQGALDALGALLAELTPGRIRAIAVDGTSGTLLLAAPDGTPLTTGRMYDDAAAVAQARLIARHAPPDSPVSTATSSLAKLLLMAPDVENRGRILALHQADWVAGKLSGRFGFSDINNALKLGYDAVNKRWPDWFEQLPLDESWLPAVLPVGSVIGPVLPELATRFGLDADTLVFAGTTDSTASVMATGARNPGDAVTVLGSTMVFKVVTTRPVSNSASGIYSHRFGDSWLAGGASNSGGAVLLSHFAPEQLNRLEAKIEPDKPTGLDYYPLLRPGERFPFNDPSMPPRLQPRPASDAKFLQGMLEGMAAIEAAAYRRLAEHGCPRPTRILTVGGGSGNDAWQSIRGRALGIPVSRAQHQEAAYGTALIARRGYRNHLSRSA